MIINEFGEIGLDHELVETSEESFVELQTGCLCCTVRGDLVLTLEDMLRRRDEGTVAPFERVVIETSGLADPAPILHALMSDAGVAGRLALGGVVTTVDAVKGAGDAAPRSDLGQAGGGRRPADPDQDGHDENGTDRTRGVLLPESPRRAQCRGAGQRSPSMAGSILAIFDTGVPIKFAPRPGCTIG